jgi:DNA-binding PadR family transcriptional regulator
VKTLPTPLTDADKVLLRARIFRNLDGIAIAPTIIALDQKGIIKEFLDRKRLNLSWIVQNTNGNEGYVNVGLRLLSSQGWLEVVDANRDVGYQITDSGMAVFKSLSVYHSVLDFFPEALNFHENLKNGFSAQNLEIIEDVLSLKSQGWKLDYYELSDDQKRQIEAHLEGVLIGPFMTGLGMQGYLAKMIGSGTLDESDFQQDFGAILKALFVQMSWLSAQTNQLTSKGMFMLKRAAAYGVTVSYFKTFTWVKDLMYGKANKLWDKELTDPEIHVDRTMNVWGSGGAHGTYFKVIDEIVRDIFNRPIDQQPRGITDMGCGNGAFLEHLFNLIYNETERGKVMDDHHLLVLGSDFNETALEVTRENLTRAEIEHYTMWGDIGDPDRLAVDLKKEYGVNLGDMLNVRSFLDHNRIFTPCSGDFYQRQGTSTGSFSFRGRRISNSEIEQNLFEHFRKWMPYVERFGLLMIELHTIPPAVAAKNLGNIAITAYDGTHGYTDQYIVEHDVFTRLAAEAGLKVSADYQALYPNTETPVVSINFLKS